MHLEINALPEGVTCLRILGRLDTSGVDAVETKFAAAATAAASPVVVDLADVDFLASMGIRMLLSTARAVKSRGQRMAICAPQPLVLDVLNRVSLGDLIPIVPSAAVAIDALRG